MCATTVRNICCILSGVLVSSPLVCLAGGVRTVPQVSIPQFLIAVFAALIPESRLGTGVVSVLHICAR